MLNNDYHRLLKRQLKKSDLDILSSSKCADFLKLVDEAYKSFDKDVKHIEHILEESSKELFQANQRLIYERDKTKTKLEHVVDNVGGVIFETDLDGNFTFLNKAWAKYTGFSIEESLGKSYKDFLIGENIEGNKKYNALFSIDNKHIKFIFKYKKDNKLMWFEVKSKHVKDNTGKSTGFIGTITDVTNLKETEVEL